MKQAGLKIRSYTRSINIVDNNNLQRRVLHVLLFVLATLAFLYIFLLGNVVFNITARRTLEANARVLANEVGNLELVYLSMSNKVDLKLGHFMGFKETKPKFAVRKSLGRVIPTGEPLDSLGSLKLAKNDL